TTRPIDARLDGAVSRAAAEAGTVLLKNAGGVLPLRRDRSVALIGPGAGTAAATGGGSSRVAALYKISPPAAFKKRGLRVRDADYTCALTNRARATPSLAAASVLENAGGFRGATKSVTVQLTAGQPHPIRVDWSKPTGQAMIELSWAPRANTRDVQIAEAVEA